MRIHGYRDTLQKLRRNIALAKPRFDAGITGQAITGFGLGIGKGLRL